MTKTEIRQYYKNLKEIERKKNQIEKLQRKLDRLANDDDITLVDDLQGVQYTDAPTAGSSKLSPQDRAINKFYHQRKRQRDFLNAQILELESDIIIIECKCIEVESVLNCLDKEDLRLIELYFRDNKTALQVSFDLCMSSSTVCRKINKILKIMG